MNVPYNTHEHILKQTQDSLSKMKELETHSNWKVFTE